MRTQWPLPVRWGSCHVCGIPQKTCSSRGRVPHFLQAFSDKNAKWLKPKKSSVFGDDEDISGDDISGDEDDEEELLDIEKQASALDAEREKDEDDAAEEFQAPPPQNTPLPQGCRALTPLRCGRIN
jgi:hypothetical protein